MKEDEVRNQSEIIWQLHTLGQRLDRHYTIEHVRIVQSNGSEHEQYVIKYNFKSKQGKL